MPLLYILAREVDVFAKHVAHLFRVLPWHGTRPPQPSQQATTQQGCCIRDALCAYGSTCPYGANRTPQEHALTRSPCRLAAPPPSAHAACVQPEAAARAVLPALAQPMRLGTTRTRRWSPKMHASAATRGVSNVAKLPCTIPFSRVSVRSVQRVREGAALSRGTVCWLVCVGVADAVWSLVQHASPFSTAPPRTCVARATRAIN